MIALIAIDLSPRTLTAAAHRRWARVPELHVLYNYGGDDAGPVVSR